MGGAVFVVRGGTLTITGDFIVNGGSVAGGGGGDGATAGSAFGSGIFLQGNGTLTVNPGAGVTQTISDAIADQTGSGGAGFFVSGGPNCPVGGGCLGYPGAGSWNLTKTGTGTLTLSGTNTYTGATTVDAGTLSVNGSIASSVLTTVNAGGTLGGTGTVGNTAIVGGTLAPGNSIGIIDVSGNLSLDGSSTYAVEVSPIDADRTNVSGTATLAGNVAAAFASGSYMVRNYTILSATGGLGGTTFGSLSTTSLPAGFTAVLDYQGNDVMLELAAALGTGGGLGGNQQNVSTAINNFFNAGGALPPGFVTLYGLTGSALANALSQASGEAGAASIQVSFNAMNGFMNAMLDPFNAGHFGNGGGAMGFAEEGRALGYTGGGARDKASEAYAAVTPRDRAPVDSVSRWNVWATGYGGSSRVDGNAATGSHDTNNQTFGTAVGADYRASSDTVVGFALGAAGFNFDLASGLGHGSATLFQAGVHGRHRMGNVYFAGALGYSWQDMETKRTVTIAGTDRLEADFHAQTFSARGETGYRFATPWLGATPYGAVQVTSFFLPSYGERATSGSAQFALSYSSETTTNVRTELGARFDKTFMVTDGLFRLLGRLAWVHDSNTDRAASAAFQTLPGAVFSVSAAEPAADAALLSIGAEMNWRNGISLAANLDGEFSSTTQSYAGKTTLRYVW
jgi:autotransporter-associated beta strand protein